MDAILVVDGVTDVYHPNAIRGSLGAIFALPVVTASSEDAAVWLAERAVRVVAAIVEAERAPWDADLTGATALVLGSEADGLGPVWRGSHVVPVALPMRGVGDSLNVSAAAAVLFYEARRQRDGGGGTGKTAGRLG